MILLPTTQFSNMYSENILPYHYTFDAPYTYAITGAGTATITSNEFMAGWGALQLYSNLTNAAVDIKPAGTDANFTIVRDDYFMFQVSIKDKLGNVAPNENLLEIHTFINNVADEILYIKKSDVPVVDKVYTFKAILPYEASDVVRYEYRLPTTAVPVESEIIVDMMKLEILNKAAMGEPSIYTYPVERAATYPIENGTYQLKVTGGYREWVKIVDETVSLNFPSTAAGAYSDLPVAIDDVFDGQSFTVGASAAVMALGDLRFTAFYSAPGIVTVRFKNNEAGAINPPSADFTIKSN